MAKEIKTVIDKTCPLCGKLVRYWANCSERTAADIHNHFYIKYKNGRKQFYHRSCFEDNNIVPKLACREE